MITFDDYVGTHAASPDLTPNRRENINLLLLPAVWKLEKVMREEGVDFPTNPATGSGVSGETLGGFRPQVCKIGAAKSNHKQGMAVDRYDPHGAIDRWCDAHPEILKACGIWLESPTATPGWSHWQCVPPKSGNRIFIP